MWGDLVKALSTTLKFQVGKKMNPWRINKMQFTLGTSLHGSAEVVPCGGSPMEPKGHMNKLENPLQDTKCSLLDPGQIGRWGFPVGLLLYWLGTWDRQ